MSVAHPTETITSVGVAPPTGTITIPTPPLTDRDIQCHDIFVYFARGSGQEPGESGKEASTFFSEVTSRISGYDVGTREVGEGPGWRAWDYPAVPAHNAVLPTGTYANSVRNGYMEAATYLSERHEACPDETWVLGGHSQGAQVMGATVTILAGYDSNVLRKHVAYVALFGDPWLALNNSVLACFGRQHPWVHDSVSCLAKGGVLGPRRPYVPDALNEPGRGLRLGSWCAATDGVCTGSKGLLVFDLGNLVNTHHNYSLTAIPEAATEAVRFLRMDNPSAPVSAFTLRPGQAGGGTDVAFVIDTTGSMSPYIAGARDAAEAMTEEILSYPKARVALVQYRDHGDSFVSKVEVPFTSDADEFRAGLGRLDADEGGDFPEAVFSGLMTAFNDLTWTPGANKRAILIADAPGKDPEPVTGYTASQVAQRAFELDPVSVFPVVTDPEDEFFESLAGQTDGRAFDLDDESSPAAALEGAVETIAAEPIAVLNGPFFGAPGQTMVLDASRSYDPDAEIVSYEWDIDGDLDVDETTSTPVLEHLEPVARNGLLGVTVVSADGGRATATAEVDVAEDALDRRRPPTPGSLDARIEADGAVTVRWSRPPGMEGEVIYVLELNGQPAVMTDGETEVALHGLPAGVPLTFAVDARQNGATSEQALFGPITIPEIKVESALDTDNDGVPDASDRCPTSPGPASNQGCRESAKPPKAKVMLRISARVLHLKTGKRVVQVRGATTPPQPGRRLLIERRRGKKTSFLCAAPTTRKGTFQARCAVPAGATGPIQVRARLPETTLTQAAVTGFVRGKAKRGKGRG